MKKKHRKQPPKYLLDVAARHRAAPDADELSAAVLRAMAAGWSQVEIAEILGSHQQQVSRWAKRRARLG